MTVDARQALARLRAALESRAIDADLERLGVRIMSAFGSAARPEGVAHDLDLAVGFQGDPDLLAVIDLLVATTGYDRIDVAIVDGQHPVLDAEALCGIPLYEDRPGAFAEAQMAALGHRRDTAWLREMDLRRMAT